MTKNKIAKAALFLLSLVIGATVVAAGELDRDDFWARPAKTDIPGVWELFVINDSSSDAEVKVICDFGRLSTTTERISVVVPANCTAKPFIYDLDYGNRLKRKPERPQCEIVSVVESSKWTPACPD